VWRGLGPDMESATGLAALHGPLSQPLLEPRPETVHRVAARNQADVSALEHDLLPVLGADHPHQVPRRLVRHDVIVLSHDVDEGNTDVRQVDQAAAERFVAARSLGAGTAAGPKSYVIDRIGEMIEAGAHEIMIGGIPTHRLDHYQMVAEEIIPAFG